MTARKIIRKAHLLLGLVSGLLVVVISITGCLYSFKEEIQNLTQSYRFVEPKQEVFLPPSELASIGKEQLPGKHLHAVQYHGNNQAAEAIFYSSDPSYYYIVYLDPYTGGVLRVKDMDADFFRIVLMGHFYLWLPPEIGQPLVASATLVFIVMLITGIILWWPKNKAAIKQRFSIRWNVGWKRKNYDLHNVLGFYSSFIVVVLALTGLVWGFEWFKNSVYFFTGGEKVLEYAGPVSSLSKKNDDTKSIQPLDAVWEFMKREYPQAYSIEVHPPETDTSSIAANANLGEGTIWKTDYRYFDQYTLKELEVDHIYGRIENAHFADKLLRMNYDIHIGAILGLPGKILAFFASFIFGSLPITGFCIWWGRKKKNKRKNKKYSTQNFSKKRLASAKQLTEF